jgi:hypothetical protein
MVFFLFEKNYELRVLFIENLSDISSTYDYILLTKCYILFRFLYVRFWPKYGTKLIRLASETFV